MQRPYADPFRFIDHLPRKALPDFVRRVERAFS